MQIRALQYHSLPTCIAPPPSLQTLSAYTSDPSGNLRQARLAITAAQSSVGAMSARFGTAAAQLGSTFGGELQELQADYSDLTKALEENMRLVRACWEGRGAGGDRGQQMLGRGRGAIVDNSRHGAVQGHRRASRQ